MCCLTWWKNSVCWGAERPGGVQAAQALALVGQGLDAHAAPHRLQDKFAGVAAAADIDIYNHIRAVGIPALIKGARAQQQVDIRAGWLRRSKKPSSLKCWLIS